LQSRLFKVFPISYRKPTHAWEAGPETKGLWWRRGLEPPLNIPDLSRALVLLAADYDGEAKGKLQRRKD
jgi:hypothetical protein